MMILFLIVLVLLAGLGILIGSLDRADILANWEYRRCNLPVIFTASLYKPPENPKDATSFAIENFQFCIRKFGEEVMTEVMAPFIKLFKAELEVGEVVAEIQNKIRGMIANFQRAFSSLLDTVFQRFMMVGFHIKLIYKKFMDAMNRAFAIALDTVFLGISMITGIENFYNFVVKVVTIMLGIMVGLIILLFFILLPVLPIIMTTIGVLVAAGVGGVSGMAGAFCFVPKTVLKKKNGDTITIDSIQIGDILEDDSIVEGIVKMDGTETQLYEIHGIKVSGSHLVYYGPVDKWIFVKDHPDAHRIFEKSEILYCLNTTTRRIPIEGQIFRDWEELPNSLKAVKGWNDLVGHLLKTSQVCNEVQSYPIFSQNWSVQEKSRGVISINTVKIGDKILDGNVFVEVLGVYEGLEEVPNKIHWYADSIRFKEGNEWKMKAQIPVPKIIQRGNTLITRSGSFSVIEKDGTSVQVRDFTEVGIENIEKTYTWMEHILSHTTTE
jgi:hypothetical protein